MNCTTPDPAGLAAGAGAFPTASSVAADLVDIAAGRHAAPFGVPAAALNTIPGAAMERHQAINWLTGGGVYSQTDTST